MSAMVLDLHSHVFCRPIDHVVGLCMVHSGCLGWVLHMKKKWSETVSRHPITPTVHAKKMLFALQNSTQKLRCSVITSC